ncbi:MAG: hypothetical protein K9K79_07270 [Desulfohalobiaceae bacterium]|nr:hypothetical protein [Desulfohalobiaceae bacterium]
MMLSYSAVPLSTVSLAMPSLAGLRRTILRGRVSLSRAVSQLAGEAGVLNVRSLIQ